MPSHGLMSRMFLAECRKSAVRPLRTCWPAVLQKPLRSGPLLLKSSWLCPTYLASHVQLLEKVAAFCPALLIMKTWHRTRLYPCVHLSSLPPCFPPPLQCSAFQSLSCCWISLSTLVLRVLSFIFCCVLGFKVFSLGVRLTPPVVDCLAV